MSLSNTDILSIYNSRKTLIDVFITVNDDMYYEYPNYKDYDSFNINEVEAMAKNDQLDMLLVSQIKPNIYVKYMLTRSTIRLQAIDDLVETLFEIENTLKKTDTLIIVVNDEPNDSMIAKLRHLFDERGIFIVMHNINRLQQNLLKHTLVPNHRVVSSELYEDLNGKETSELDQLMTKYKLKNLNQLPEISRFDPIALLTMLRPGQVCEINRKSATSVSTLYYRICV
jgi:DNA-directed RNA polymerase subunit H (RpoH/RPB5)